MRITSREKKITGVTLALIFIYGGFWRVLSRHQIVIILCYIHNVLGLWFFAMGIKICGARHNTYRGKPLLKSERDYIMVVVITLVKPGERFYQPPERRSSSCGEYKHFSAIYCISVDGGDAEQVDAEELNDTFFSIHQEAKEKNVTLEIIKIGC